MRRALALVVCVACVGLVACESSGELATSGRSAPTTTTTIDKERADAALQDVLPVQTAQPAQVQTPVLSSLVYGPSVDTGTLSQFLTAVVQDVAGFWRNAFTGAGRPWKTVLFRFEYGADTVASECTDQEGNAAINGDPDLVEDANPANYCPRDNTISLSLQWIHDNIWARHVSQQRQGGDFGVASVVAHEMGHMVQTYLGISNPTQSPTVKPVELQADCLAGVWANSKYYQGALEPGDFDVAVESFEAVGDYEYWSPGHHGTPAERHEAFVTGYNAGRGAACTLDLGDAF